MTTTVSINTIVTSQVYRVSLRAGEHILEMTVLGRIFLVRVGDYPIFRKCEAERVPLA